MMGGRKITSRLTRLIRRVVLGLVGSEHLASIVAAGASLVAVLAFALWWREVTMPRLACAGPTGDAAMASLDTEHHLAILGVVTGIPAAILCAYAASTTRGVLRAAFVLMTIALAGWVLFLGLVLVDFSQPCYT
jgi:hypothetical protein